MSESKKVLVVDDDDAVHFALEMMLKRAGIASLHAGSVREATAMLSPEVGLVLTDIVMPEKDGQEFLLELRTTHPNLPVITMSGYAHPGTETTCEALGALAHLHKPFLDDDEVLKLIADNLP